jgi:hypothetical protein
VQSVPRTRIADDDVDLLSLDLNGYGYRWLRLDHTHWD